MIFKWAVLKFGLIKGISISKSHMTFLTTFLKQTKSVSFNKKSNLVLRYKLFLYKIIYI